MTQNTAPVFTKIPRVQSIAILSGAFTASAKSDGNGTVATDMFIAFQADATNGSYVQRLRIHPYATTPTATTAALARIFISSLDTGTVTPTDTHLFQEIALPVSNAANATSPCNFYEIPLNFALPADYTILISIHQALAANTGWRFTVFGGDY